MDFFVMGCKRERASDHRLKETFNLQGFKSDANNVLF